MHASEKATPNTLSDPPGSSPAATISSFRRLLSRTRRMIGYAVLWFTDAAEKDRDADSIASLELWGGMFTRERAPPESKKSDCDCAVDPAPPS